MTDELDEEMDALMADLVADETRRPTRNRRQVSAREKRRKALRAQLKEPVEELDTRLETVVKGVSVTWLAKALRMDLADVKRRLASVAPMHGAKTQAHYDLKTAVPHLVDPVQDVEQYIRNMDSKMLPPRLQEGFWKGQQVRLRTMRESKELWDTGQVVEVFGIVFKKIRDQTNLWLDTLDDVEHMTEKQRHATEQLVHALNKDILASVTEYTQQHATPSQLAYLEEYAREHS